jgi:hypothetical protein
MDNVQKHNVCTNNHRHKLLDFRYIVVTYIRNNY